MTALKRETDSAGGSPSPPAKAEFLTRPCCLGLLLIIHRALVRRGFQTAEEDRETAATLASKRLGEGGFRILHVVLMSLSEK